MGTINRILAVVVMGAVALLVIAAPASMLAQAATFGQPGAAPWSVGLPFLVVCAAVLLIAASAPTARHAWGRLALVEAIACFALPFAGMAFAAILGAHAPAARSGAEQAGIVAGSALAGVALAGTLGFVGFFAGLILLVVAFFMLRGGAVPSRARQPKEGS